MTVETRAVLAASAVTQIRDVLARRRPASQVDDVWPEKGTRRG
jgi:hypothetical protein